MEGRKEREEKEIEGIEGEGELKREENEMEVEREEKEMEGGRERETRVSNLWWFILIIIR